MSVPPHLQVDCEYGVGAGGVRVHRSGGGDSGDTVMIVMMITVMVVMMIMVMVAMMIMVMVVMMITMMVMVVLERQRLWGLRCQE